MSLLYPLALAVALWLFVRRRRGAAARIGDPGVLRRVAGGDLTRIPWTRVVLVLVAGVALGAALLDPRGSDEPAGEVRGGRLVLVLDASSSMLAADVQPDRLEVEREVARTILRELPGTPTGLIVFAGRAFVLSPPTPDAGALELFVDALDPGIVTQTGSSLSSAIRQGVGLLAAGDAPGGAHALVLVSDGDALEPREAIDEAVAAAEGAGIEIHTVGVGTEAGARVPHVDPATGRVVGFRLDPDGEIAVSRLRPALLQEIAAATGGEYAPASDPGAMAGLLAELRRTVGRGADPDAGGPPLRYAWFTGLALCSLAAEALWASSRGRRD